MAVAQGQLGSFRVDLDDPNVWQKRIKLAEEYRDDRADDLGWDRSYDAVQGKILDEEPLDNTVVVNFPYAYVAQMVPTVYFTHPRFMVRPAREAFRASAIMMESALNFECRRMRIERPIRRCIQDALIFGVGYGKLGWASEYGELPPTKGSPPRLSGEKRSHQRRIGLKAGRPFFSRIDPRMALVDPYASCWEEARWFVHAYFAPYDWLLKDPLVDNKREISPGWSLQNTQMQQLARQFREPQDQHRVLCYEVWDLDSGKVRMICEGSEKWQRVENNPYDGLIDGLPFYPLTPSDGLFDWFGESPIHMFLDQVVEISKIRTKQLDHIYRMPGKILANRTVFTDEEVRQMRDPDEHFVTCTDPNQVKDFSALRPDPNMYIVEERAKGDIEHVSGFSELTLGKTPGSRTTATVGMIAARASSVRIKRIIDAVKEFVVWAGTDLSALISAFTPDDYQIQVAGDRGIEWMTVGRNDLKGEFFFDIDVTEMAPISRELRQKEAIDLYALLAQAPEVKRRRVIEDVLRAYSKTEVDAYLNPDLGPPVDPAYENALMLKGVEVLPNPAEDLALHLQVHNDFVEDPQVAQILQTVPAIRNTFSAHMQLTMQLMRQVDAIQSAAQVQGQAGPQSPVNPEAAGPGGGMSTLQSGRPLAGAQPVGATTEGGV